MQTRKFYLQHHFKILSPPKILFLFIFLKCLALTTTSGNLPELFTPADNILINCGFSGNSTSLDGRKWTGDMGSQFISSEEMSKTSVASEAFGPSPSIDPVPYKTARIFLSQLTYTIHVSSGLKFIRLYFSPITYHEQKLNVSNAFFNVTVGPFSLLSNFSPPSLSFVKEFCVNVEENQILRINFSPSTSTDSYGFINGIEVMSMPTDLYYTRSGVKGIPFINNDTFVLQNYTALETVHRLNVGGSSILPADDSGMFRSWSKDTDFLQNFGEIVANKSTPISYTKFPSYTAPPEVYQTAQSSGQGLNLTWRLPVDSGFRYLIRFHFCELLRNVDKSGGREFKIIIGDGMAENLADIIDWSGGIGIPTLKDYVFQMPRQRTGKEKDLFIVLCPIGKSRSILNGLEVFKINHTEGNLGKSSITVDLPKTPHNQAKGSKTMKKTFIAISGPTIVFLVLVGLAIFWMCRRSGCNEQTNITPMLERMCRQFTAAEMKYATHNFDADLVIGSGGFGRVYKGHVGSETMPVAIKVLKPTSRQGSKEFRTEIEMLSKLHHHHLVSLIGYCDTEGLMMLVYDYMANGSLRDHLYNTDKPPLSWKERLQICIGAACGIEHLHVRAKPIIIHRDIKTSNILLDEKWVPKVSDFGLSRLGPISPSRSHVTTNVAGTFGYLDPEYFQTNHLSEKSDVYSFGAVMLEVLCGRSVVDVELEEEEHSLVLWARKHVKHGSFDQIVDPNLKGQIAPASLKVYARIFIECIRDHRKDRPTMSQVLKKLKLALKLQERAEATAEEGIMLDGSDLEEISLCGDGSYTVTVRPVETGRPAHSCPIFWQKGKLNNKGPRFFSERAGVKFPKPPSLRGLKAFFFAVSAYKTLPREQGHMLDSSTPQQDSTSGKGIVEIMNSGGECSSSKS